MFIAMNRFKVVPGQEENFETVWSTRETRLPEMDGFVAFKLLRGTTTPEHTLFASHTVWQSKTHFDGWVNSQAFGKSHQGDGRLSSIVLGHPEFEGFEVLQELSAA